MNVFQNLYQPIKVKKRRKIQKSINLKLLVYFYIAYINIINLLYLYVEILFQHLIS